MANLKYSRQRESIKAFLAGRTDHPTADTIYVNIKQQYPNISLGTVYRNLALLESLGEIKKISFGDGAEHFDPNTDPHYHFICRSCGQVSDLPMKVNTDIERDALLGFDGSIDSHEILFYGTCAYCRAKEGQA